MISKQCLFLLTEEIFLAKSPEGAPVFLLSNSDSKKYYPNIVFRNISVDFNVTCSININDRNLIGDFCVVRFTESLPELYEIFVKTVCSVIENLPTNTSAKELESFILELRELFRTLNASSGREISGLWSELFIIFISGNPSNALRAWHNNTCDRFDFSNNHMRLEVKSTICELRSHDFSLEQLVPHANGDGFIASFLLRKSNFGCGVLKLATQIEQQVNGIPDLKQKLWRNIIKALGADFSEKLDELFDLELAKKELRIYSMEDIPRPSCSNDGLVTKIRFNSNLENLPYLPSKELPKELERMFGETQFF
ncbi:hypothetical protein ACVWVS_002003 [Ewingella americana]